MNNNDAPTIQQSRMFFRFYIFLCDYKPQGLTGDWAHIKGQDVMDHLLCHNEPKPSHHKISKAAHTAFTNLEKWMGEHSDWRSSLQQAKNNAAQPSKTKKGGKQKEWRAPGLYTPAGFLAVIIIGHPNSDSVLKLIGRLEINWMLQPRSTLDVQEGFWKGLNASNLNEVFSEEEERQADNSPLIDYTALFQNFEAARNDIRPYVKGWEHRISLHKAPNTAKNHSSIVPAQETVEAAALKSLLYPDTTKGMAELETWLISKLADSQSDASLLHQWCQHWEGRIDAVANYEEQLIVRFLFEQSLRRLASVNSTDTLVARLYMLLDMDEAELQPKRILAEGMGETWRSVESLPQYEQCLAVNEKLLAAANYHQAMKKTINELWAQQLHFFQIMKTTVVHADWEGAMRLEAEHTQVILNSFRDAPGDDEPWRGKKDVIWDKETIKILNLTRWRLRALVAPGAFNILTGWQARVFHQKFCLDLSQRTSKNEAEYIDLSDYKPMSVPGSSFVKEHGSLHKLLGKLNKPLNLTTVKPYMFAQGPTEEVMPTSAQPSAKPKPIPTSLPSMEIVHEVAQDIAPETAQADGVPVLDKPHLVSAPTTLQEQPDGFSRSFLRREEFLGKRSKKRVASPDHRPSKAVKLDREIKKLRKDQELFQNSIQDVINCAVKERVKKEHKKLSSQFQQGHDRLEGITSKQLVDLVTQATEAFKSQDELHKQTQLKLNEQQTQLQKMQEEMQEDIKEMRDDIKEDKKLRDKLRAKIPFCPAPLGYDQETYDSMLIGAAWSYITYFRDRNEGVELDEGALKAMEKRFSELKSEDMIKVLEHVHMKAYKKPLCEEEKE